MIAMVLNKPNKIENEPLKYDDVLLPEICDDEIKIKIHVCGVCHTDLHIVEGEISLYKLPIIQGHQVVGEVIEIGDKVKNFKSGDIVGISWLYSACENCKFCIKKSENLCSNAKFTGLHVNGGFAEYIISKEKFTYHINRYLPEENIAPLLCGGVIGYRALKKAIYNTEKDEIIGLYGFGASAHIVLQIARYLGYEVYVFTRSIEHKKIALSLGASWVGNVNTEPPKKISAGIIFAPIGEIVSYTLKTLEKDGKIVLAGIYMTPIPEIPYEMLYMERKIETVANSTREDVISLFEVAKKANIKTEIEIFELEKINEILKKIKYRKMHCAGVVKI